MFFAATEHSAGFLDALSAEYALRLRQRSRWLVEQYGALSDAQLEALVRENIGKWGTEFEMESVLWDLLWKNLKDRIEAIITSGSG